MRDMILGTEDPPLNSPIIHISHFSLFFFLVHKFLVIFSFLRRHVSHGIGACRHREHFFLPGKTETSPRYGRRVNYGMLYSPRCDCTWGGRGRSPPRSRHRDRTSWFFLRDERVSTLSLLPGIAFPRGETTDMVADLAVRVTLLLFHHHFLEGRFRS